MLEPVFTPLSHSIPEDNSLHCCSFSISRLSVFLLTALISCCRNSGAAWTLCPPISSAGGGPVRQRDAAHLKLCWGDQALLNQTNALLKTDMDFAAHGIVTGLSIRPAPHNMLTRQPLEESSI